MDCNTIKTIADETLKKIRGEQCLKVLLIGGCIGDIVATIDSIPQKGMDATATIIEEQVGGCALNVARVLHTFNTPVINAMPVGEGKWADKVRSELIKLDLPINLNVPDRDNGHCIALVTPDKERTFITFEGAETIFNFETLNKFTVNKNTLIYVNGYEIAIENDLVRWISSIKIGKFIVDLGPMIFNISKKTIDMLLNKKNIIFTLNEKEAEFLIGNLNEENLKNYAKKHDVELVIRRGNKSTYCVDKTNRFFSLPSIKAKAIDTIGAGDFHTGAMIAGLCVNLNLPHACLLGNISGAHNVTCVGATDTCSIYEYERILKNIISGEQNVFNKQ